MSTMAYQITSHTVVYNPYRGCDLCASLLRPQNWPGRRWRQKGDRAVSLVVQGRYMGRSDIALNAIVAVKFWACLKQSHKGRRRGRSLIGGSKEAWRRHTHRRGRRMDAHRLVIGRPIKNAYCCEHCVSIWATLLPSLYHHCASFGRPIASIERSLWRPLCLHSATTTTLEPPWQRFCLHSASSARPVVTLQQLWSFKEGTRIVLQQLHRNRTFWVWATTEHIVTIFLVAQRVAQMWQPCVKGALRNHLFRRRSKKTSKLRVTGPCAGHRLPINSPHKGPVMRKMIQCDDVIMDLDIGIDINLDIINTLRPRLNRRHFADNISNRLSWMKIYEFRLKFHWSLFLRVQCTFLERIYERTNHVKTNNK